MILDKVVWLVRLLVVASITYTSSHAQVVGPQPAETDLSTVQRALDQYYSLLASLEMHYVETWVPDAASKLSQQIDASRKSRPTKRQKTAEPQTRIEGLDPKPVKFHLVDTFPYMKLTEFDSSAMTSTTGITRYQSPNRYVEVNDKGKLVTDRSIFNSAKFAYLPTVYVGSRIPYSTNQRLSKLLRVDSATVVIGSAGNLRDEEKSNDLVRIRIGPVINEVVRPTKLKNGSIIDLTVSKSLGYLPTKIHYDLSNDGNQLDFSQTIELGDYETVQGPPNVRSLKFPQTIVVKSGFGTKTVRIESIRLRPGENLEVFNPIIPPSYTVQVDGVTKKRVFSGGKPAAVKRSEEISKKTRELLEKSGQQNNTFLRSISFRSVGVVVLSFMIICLVVVMFRRRGRANKV